MSVTIFNDHKEILHTSPAAPKPLGSPVQFSESQYRTESPFWHCTAHEYGMDGMHIGLHQAQVFEKIHIRASDTAPVLSMLFMEQGTLEVHPGNREEPYRFSTNQHNLLFDAYSTECTTMPGQQLLRLSILSFYPGCFLRLAEGNGRLMEKMASKVAANESWVLNGQDNPLQSARMQLILSDIKRPQFSGSAKKMFLEAKMLEMLSLQLEQFESGTAGKRVFAPGKSDSAKLHMAKELLESQIDFPHSLASIARATGLNEYKLKSGFKTLFGKPVFGYLRDLRLGTAFEEIVSTDKPLSQIASDIGFSSPQHFSLAFKKQFGASPVQLRKK